MLSIRRNELREDKAPLFARGRAHTSVMRSHCENRSRAVRIRASEVRRRGCTCMKMKTYVVLLSVFLPVVEGQVFRWGPCPDPAVQPNFNLCMYLGKWYEIEKLPASFEKGKCIEANYSLRADGTIKVLNMEVVKGVPHSIEGTAVVQDIDQPAKLGVSFSFFTPYRPYWVLSTDYETSAVVYSCIDVLRIFHVEYAWILGRTRSLPELTVNGSKEILIGSNVDVSRMTPTDQEGCEVVV